MRSGFLFLLACMLVFMVASINMDVCAEVIEDGLISYWTFNKADIDGDTAKDVWGNNDGAIIGGPSIVQGKFGEALDFDGADDYVDCGVGDSLDVTSAVTIEVWVKGTFMPAWNAIVCKRPQERSWFIGADSVGKIDFDVSGDGTSWGLVNHIGTANVADDEWHHLVGTYDGKTGRIYVDGVLDAEGGTPGEIMSHLVKTTIGSTGSTYFTKAIIDEVRIYERALSEAEIAQNMDSAGLAVTSYTDKLALTWGAVKVSR